MASDPGHVHDDDELDGCEIDFAEHADDPETAAMRPLAPEGVLSDEDAAFYRALADADV